MPRECPTEKIVWTGSIYWFRKCTDGIGQRWRWIALDSAIYRMKLYYPAAKALGRSYCAIDSYSWSVDRDLSRQCIAVSTFLLNNWGLVKTELEWLCTGSALQLEVAKWKVKRYSLISSKHNSLFSPTTFTEISWVQSMGESWNFGVSANLFSKTYKSTTPSSSRALEIL